MSRRTVPTHVLDALARAMVAVRERDGLDQTEMGRALDNLTQQSISKTERGNGGPVVLRLFLEYAKMTEAEMLAKYGARATGIRPVKRRARA